jgi:hypothetical protein
MPRQLLDQKMAEATKLKEKDDRKKMRDQLLMLTTGEKKNIFKFERILNFFVFLKKEILKSTI